jgi:hypothetical protein
MDYGLYPICDQCRSRSACTPLVLAFIPYAASVDPDQLALRGFWLLSHMRPVLIQISLHSAGFGFYPICNQCSSRSACTSMQSTPVFYRFISLFLSKKWLVLIQMQGYTGWFKYTRAQDHKPEFGDQSQICSICLAEMANKQFLKFTLHLSGTSKVKSLGNKIMEEESILLLDH